jgi:hypothetical protein
MLEMRCLMTPRNGLTKMVMDTETMHQETSLTNSHLTQLNGEIPMVMDTEITP